MQNDEREMQSGMELEDESYFSNALMFEDQQMQDDERPTQNDMKSEEDDEDSEFFNALMIKEERMQQTAQEDRASTDQIAVYHQNVIKEASTGHSYIDDNLKFLHWCQTHRAHWVTNVMTCGLARLDAEAVGIINKRAKDKHIKDGFKACVVVGIYYKIILLK